MIKQTKYYYNYILILMGLGLVSWVIWARFLRIRAPLLDQLKKDGFNLTEQSSINSDEHSYSVFEESPTYQGESVEELNPIIGINLCTVDPNKKNHTPEQRHINVATIDKEGVATSSSYITSSKGHSKEKHNHGVPNNPRISNEKFNGQVEYVNTIFTGMTDQGDAYTGKTPGRTISPDNEDGSGCVEESKIKGGQFLRVLHNAMEIKKEDYTIDERATVYLNQPEVFSIVAPIHEKALTKSTPKDIYDPNTTTQNKTPAIVTPSMNTNETTNNIENAEEID